MEGPIFFERWLIDAPSGKLARAGYSKARRDGNAPMQFLRESARARNRHRRFHGCGARENAPMVQGATLLVVGKSHRIANTASPAVRFAEVIAATN
jgi:hypothetical protein